MTNAAQTGSNRRLITVKSAADFACVTTRTIYNWIADGQLTRYRLGKRMVRIDAHELENLAVADQRPPRQVDSRH